MFQVNNNYKTSFGIFNTNFENRPILSLDW